MIALVRFYITQHFVELYKYRMDENLVVYVRNFKWCVLKCDIICLEKRPSSSGKLWFAINLFNYKTVSVLNLREYLPILSQNRNLVSLLPSAFPREKEEGLRFVV